MVDVVTPEVRSKMMSGIRGRDTKPEMIVRRYLHRAGLRFRLHDRSLPSVPDLVFSQFRVVVFVHGCYWHRHKACKYATTPVSNREFWLKKICGNVERDKRNIERLTACGWRVIIIWECGLRGNEATAKLKWLPDSIRLGNKPVIEWPKNGAT